MKSATSHSLTRRDGVTRWKLLIVAVAAAIFSGWPATGDAGLRRVVRSIDSVASDGQRFVVAGDIRRDVVFVRDTMRSKTARWNAPPGCALQQVKDAASGHALIYCGPGSYFVIDVRTGYAEALASRLLVNGREEHVDFVRLGKRWVQATPACTASSSCDVFVDWRMGQVLTHAQSEAPYVLSGAVPEPVNYCKTRGNPTGTYAYPYRLRGGNPLRLERCGSPRRLTLARHWADAAISAGWVSWDAGIWSDSFAAYSLASHRTHRWKPKWTRGPVLHTARSVIVVRITDAPALGYRGDLYETPLPE